MLGSRYNVATTKAPRRELFNGKKILICHYLKHKHKVSFSANTLCVHRVFFCRARHTATKQNKTIKVWDSWHCYLLNFNLLSSSTEYLAVWDLSFDSWINLMFLIWHKNNLTTIQYSYIPMMAFKKNWPNE